VSSKFKKRRLVQGYSQTKISVLAGVSPAMIVSIEKYGYTPGPAVRAKLVKALGVAEADLWPRLKKLPRMGAVQHENETSLEKIKKP